MGIPSDNSRFEQANAEPSVTGHEEAMQTNSVAAETKVPTSPISLLFDSMVRSRPTWFAKIGGFLLFSLLLPILLVLSKAKSKRLIATDDPTKEYVYPMF